MGLKVDIRDSNNIWCEGTSTLTQVLPTLLRADCEDHNKGGPPLETSESQLCGKYASMKNYLEKIEEDVSVGSERLATRGFFTSRQDIPHYG